mmetsp:Transcript_7980/g.11648  ORF Transcript_7980/g.11648 Transcript_7980/m.11648 type:complete len:332 (-) Transcript_7980:206-1201(-)|eukprot:CAMPEP_0194031744 /NCGR_PEP_ID=MMETSP0009_2-20130614/4841_1 /TAXON_ID=210454 /ORGANISM="Grammatophora oceanica, Strain CCMP 410" /LENGTH=331 /DNA_ID=CAMNT_0038671975 /DNA_START=66 /DNA_END=1061 /DNA_ORIENTATION=-
MSHRKSTPRGQMTRGANSGPAIMLLPPHLRMMFGPNPPLEWIPPVRKKRRQRWTGMSGYMKEFEKKEPPKRVLQPTPKKLKVKAQKDKKSEHEAYLEPLIEEYRKKQRAGVGGMNCYNTLFVGRLAYEVTDRQLLREMEQFGPIQDLILVKDTTDKKSRGYAFLEFEREEDMKRAYRHADGMKLEGRPIVVDVERGHTVPNWLPRRLGGGLGATRLGGKNKNVTAPGRFDPKRQEEQQQKQQEPQEYGGRGSLPPTGYGGGGGGGGFSSRGGGSSYSDRGRGGGGGGGGSSSRRYDDGRGGGGDDSYRRKRGRSRSPDYHRRGSSSSRRRY